MASDSSDRLLSFQFIMQQLEDQNYIPPEEVVPLPDQVIPAGEADHLDGIEMAEGAMEIGDPFSPSEEDNLDDPDHEARPAEEDTNANAAPAEEPNPEIPNEADEGLQPDDQEAQGLNPDPELPNAGASPQEPVAAEVQRGRKRQRNETS